MYALFKNGHLLKIQKGYFEGDGEVLEVNFTDEEIKKLSLGCLYQDGEIVETSSYIDLQISYEKQLYRQKEQELIDLDRQIEFHKKKNPNYNTKGQELAASLIQAKEAKLSEKQAEFDTFVLEKAEQYTPEQMNQIIANI